MNISMQTKINDLIISPAYTGGGNVTKLALNWALSLICIDDLAKESKCNKATYSSGTHNDIHAKVHDTWIHS